MTAGAPGDDGSVAPAPGRRRLLSLRAFGLVVASLIVLIVLLPGRYLYRFMGVGAREVAGHFQLYVVGGSSARGVPYEPRSFGHIVSHMLGGVAAGRPIAVHVLAADGESIYAQAVRFRRITASRDPSLPGAVLVYSGHNEAIQRPPAHDVWLDRAERWGFDRSLIARELIHGLRRLFDRPPVATMERYEFYLTTVIEDAMAAGLTPIVSSVAGNVSGVEPNVVIFEDPTQVFDTLYRSGPLEGNGCEPALEGATAKLSHIEGLAPLLVYLGARCLASLGRHEEAREAYWRALELDPRTNFGRATRAQNAVVARVAEDHGVRFVDSVARFAAASPHGIIDSGLFSDAHHPNMEGYLLVADGFARALADLLGGPPPEPFSDEHAYLARHPLAERPLAAPELWGGSFLIATAAHHPWPLHRLRLAERNYRGAVAKSPFSFSAWAGLGLAQAGKRGLLTRAANVHRLAGWRVFFSRRFEVPPGELIDFLGLLTTYEVDPTIRARILLAHKLAVWGSWLRR